MYLYLYDMTMHIQMYINNKYISLRQATSYLGSSKLPLGILTHLSGAPDVPFLFVGFRMLCCSTAEFIHCSNFLYQSLFLGVQMPHVQTPTGDLPFSTRT